MDSNSSGSPVLVDLFCGAGGLSDGLRQAGFRPYVGIDFDRVALATYKANHPGATAICRDIAEVPASEVLEAVGGREIDLIAGGPSCQAYSTVGKRIEDDPRNFLFKHFVRMVGELQPKFFVMENVKGLLSFRKGVFRQIIIDSFADAGYRIVSGVLNAADYGVPQRRNRIVFIGSRLDCSLCMPEPTHTAGESVFGCMPHVTVQDAIGDLPLLNGDLDADGWEYASAPLTEFQKYVRFGIRSKYVTLHQANGISANAIDVVRRIKEGNGIRSLSPEELPERFRRMRTIKDGSLRKDCTTLYHRLSRKAPAYTITCYFRNVASGPFVHPLENRSLSYREASRLMSFRDSYNFVGPMLTRQIGNAVPPLLAKAIGRHILTLMGKSAPTKSQQTRQLALS